MPQTPPKATFQMSYPTGDSSFSSSNFRNNFQSLYEGDFLPLRALAHATPDSSLMILGADAGDFSVPIYYGHANQKVYVSASGDTSNFSYPASNDRIDVVHMDASGDFHITAGSESASPVIPPFPSGEVIPVVAVYHRLGSTKIANYADKDSYSGDSYIYRDMRPLYSLPKASDTSNLATKALDNLSSVAINEDLLPDSDNARDLGSAAKEFKDLHLDGTANIDSLVADTADINGGTIDGTSIGATTPAASKVSTLVVGTPNQGDVFYDDGTDHHRLAPGTSGDVLITEGASKNPRWGSVGSISIQTFTSSGTWTKPSSGTMAHILIWGGGGGGKRDNDGGTGGGGGGCNEIIFPLSKLGATETITIGAGGTPGAITDHIAGGTGGNSTFGSHITAYGGYGGYDSTAPGGGGGEIAVGTQGVGGAWGGGEGGVRSSTRYGGGGGGGTAGTAFYGGGGGGNYNGNGAESLYGGNGGDGNGGSGTQPGGGGAGSNSGTVAGTGGAGQCIVTVF